MFEKVVNCPRNKKLNTNDKRIKLQVLDYIRITGISDITFISSDTFNVTFNIVYSDDPSFKSPKRGIFTVNLSDFIDIPNLNYQGMEKIASRLTGQVLMRGKEEGGAVTILHLLGMNLSDWLIRNVIGDLKNPV
jgi:hypothetical protein